MLCFLYYGLLLYAVARDFRLVLVSLSVVSLEQFHSLKLKLIDFSRLIGIYGMKQNVGLAHSFLYIGGVSMSGCVPVSLSHIHLRRTRLPVRAKRLVQALFLGLLLHAVGENTLRLFGRYAVGDRIGRHKASCLLSQRRTRRLTRRRIVGKQCRNSKHKHSNCSSRCHPKSNLA